MRDLTNLTQEDAKRTGWKVLVDLQSEVVGKATYDGDERNELIMKSTKRFRVPGGWIYNTSTEYHIEDVVSVAEALVFVPQETTTEKEVSYEE